jgi:hypothetical protein
MASFGFGLVAFFRSLLEESPGAETRRLRLGAIYFGTALILLGIGATVLAGLSHLLTLRRLLRGQPLVLTHWPLSVTVAMLFALSCLAGLWGLFVQ